MNVGRFKDRGFRATFMWQDMLDQPEQREHDEAEGGVGGVEAIGTRSDEIGPARAD